MRRVKGSVVALLGVMLLAVSWMEAAPQQPKTKSNRKSAAAAATYGNADAITAEELKEYEYFLASDELEGRYQPSRGYNTAAKYIASQLYKWGLKPGGSTTGNDGPLEPYLMPIELVGSPIECGRDESVLEYACAACRRRSRQGGRCCGRCRRPPQL